MKLYFEEEGEYLNKDVSITAICKKIGCNPREFPKLLKDECGIGINRLINQYRIRHAIDMIENGYLKRLTVESLAEEVGFRSRNTFYLAFKKETGLSPSAFVDSVVDLEWVGLVKI
uniref:helix-turn-helix transcriptional regulator n=1 Tax=Algoriphagus locisalis TaxID=305507 RepID=UPI00147AFBE9|nr:helix-turn-helix transcriptional regulator [Algoriphagus locisalis]